MANPQGAPIWYELMTPDPDGAKAFYEGLVEWTIEAQPAGPIDYRMIGAPGGLLGGVMRLSDEMQAGGARPGWLFYLGVDDVDQTTDKARAHGAQVFVPPTDIPNVGRFALIADPQGAPFYVMRPLSETESTVFAPGQRGRCSWNELSTPDAKSALEFYREMFGWENRETMDMGPMGGYHFLDLGDLRLGALVEQRDLPASWSFYFNVADIEQATDRAKAGGGAILMGPHQVPTGDRIVIGADPQGARFALVGPGEPPKA